VATSLVLIKSDGSTSEISLDSGRVVVGRDTSCQLRIPLAAVSREHCEILSAGERIALRDLGSSNGSYVNGERVTEATLSAGDLVIIGPCLFIVRVDGEPAQIDGPTLLARHGTGRENAESDEFADLTPLAGSSDDSSLVDFDFMLDDDEDENQPAL